MNLQELRQKKGELADQAKQILDAATADGRMELKAEEEQKFDAIHADIEKLTKTIQRLEKQEALEQPEQRRTSPNPPSETRRTAAGRPSVEDRALAFHGWMASSVAEGADFITQRHRDAAQRCGISLDQNKLRIRLAAQPLKSLRADDVREWEQRLTQVDVVSPDLGGHYTVPDEMMRPLEVALLQFGGMRQVAEVIRTQTGAELPIPQLDDTGNQGALLGEGLEHTELDTEFTQLVLNAFKYTSKRVPVSVEYLQDNAINFVGRIGAILGERIGRITNTHFTTGDGSSKPRGIMTAATSSGVTTSSATAVSYDNLIDLKHSVDPAYRALGARFMFNDTTLKILKKIKVPQFSGDTAGMPLWRAGLAAGEPDTIDGDPYTINQQVASGSSARSIAYGLLSKYVIRDVRDITLVRLDERYAELGVVAFLAFSRHDGDLNDAGTHPVKYLTQG